jgi:hypothetical protein
MAETFTNFLSKSISGEKVIVPVAGDIVKIDSTNSASGEVLRAEESTAQVHSIYITQYTNSRIRDDNRYDTSNFNYVDLYIEDTDTNAKVYVAYDLQIVPGSSYYIEKNITLTPTQCLKINVPSSQGLNGKATINVMASTVLFTEDVEE